MAGHPTLAMGQTGFSPHARAVFNRAVRLGPLLAIVPMGQISLVVNIY